jgi:hypothetical protein
MECRLVKTCGPGLGHPSPCSAAPGYSHPAQRSFWRRRPGADDGDGRRAGDPVALDCWFTEEPIGQQRRSGERGSTRRWRPARNRSTCVDNSQHSRLPTLKPGTGSRQSRPGSRSTKIECRQTSFSDTAVPSTPATPGTSAARPQLDHRGTDEHATGNPFATCEISVALPPGCLDRVKAAR